MKAKCSSARTAVASNRSRRDAVVKHCVLAVVLAFAPLVRELRAQVDQENWIDSPDPTKSLQLSPLNLQQEFTPGMTALDSVQLWAAWAGPDVLDTKMDLSIRQGGIDGPVIATSLDGLTPGGSLLPAYYYGPVIFRFPDPVALVPGQSYALQPVLVPPNTSWVLLGTAGASSYPEGRLLSDGSLMPGDLIFREGLGIPEPTPLVMLVIGIGVPWLGRTRLSDQK